MLLNFVKPTRLVNIVSHLLAIELECIGFKVNLVKINSGLHCIADMIGTLTTQSTWPK
jgi:hypothetical protein